MRDAADYVASLRDGRAIFLDGARVADVTTHPAFAESISRIAERYDVARLAPDVTTRVDPSMTSWCRGSTCSSTGTSSW